MAPSGRETDAEQAAAIPAPPPAEPDRALAFDRDVPTPPPRPAAKDSTPGRKSDFPSPAPEGEPKEEDGALRLALVRNAAVEARLAYFAQGAGHSTIEVGLERSGLYSDMIRRVFRDEGVPEELLYMAQAESAFKPEAVSRSAARGMWQFMAARGEEYGLRQNYWIDERSDPEKSTRAAAKHLRDLFDQFGDWYLAMAAYNSGPARVASAIERGNSSDFWTLSEQGLLPAETRDYVPTIVAMAIIAEDPEAWGFEVTPAPAIGTERMAVGQATDLRIVAERLDLPLTEIQGLNPHVLRWATPPDDPDFELVLPDGYAPLFEERIGPLPEEARILFRHHVVENGETLSFIARLHDVPVSVIAEANHLPDPDAIRIGQSLVIPLSGIAAAATLPDNPTLEAAPETPPATYKVRSGDTLSGIAARFGLRVEEIREWNGMTSSLLIAGSTLDLAAPAPPSPAPGSKPALSETAPDGTVIYSVQPGDTLTRIAAAYQTSVEALRQSNLDSDLSVIYPGDRIRIHAPGEAENE